MREWEGVEEDPKAGRKCVAKEKERERKRKRKKERNSQKTKVVSILLVAL